MWPFFILTANQFTPAIKTSGVMESRMKRPYGQ
jgi:hypothetical protein